MKQAKAEEENRQSVQTDCLPEHLPEVDFNKVRPFPRGKNWEKSSEACGAELGTSENLLGLQHTGIVCEVLSLTTRFSFTSFLWGGNVGRSQNPHFQLIATHQKYKWGRLNYATAIVFWVLEKMKSLASSQFLNPGSSLIHTASSQPESHSAWCPTSHNFRCYQGSWACSERSQTLKTRHPTDKDCCTTEQRQMGWASPSSFLQRLLTSVSYIF